MSTRRKIKSTVCYYINHMSVMDTKYAPLIILVEIGMGCELSMLDPSTSRYRVAYRGQHGVC